MRRRKLEKRERETFKHIFCAKIAAENCATPQTLDPDVFREKLQHRYSSIQYSPKMFLFMLKNMDYLENKEVMDMSLH